MPNCEVRIVFPYSKLGMLVSMIESITGTGVIALVLHAEWPIEVLAFLESGQSGSVHEL